MEKKEDIVLVVVQKHSFLLLVFFYLWPIHQKWSHSSSFFSYITFSVLKILQDFH